MATISIADNDARVQYTQAVTADTTQLTIDFPFFSLDDINVIVTSSAGVDTTLTRGTGTGTFAVVGTSVDDGFSGGHVTLGDTYSNAATKYTIFRDISVTRTTDFPTSGPFNVSSLNTELDKIFAIEQELETKIGRTMRLADSDSAATLSLPNVDTRKGTVLAFNSTTGLPEAGPEIGDVSTIAAITADIGTLADIEDGTDATDAIQTVAGISANVTTVAGMSANVTTVAGISSNISTVAGDTSNIGTVAGAISNINTVAGNNANVTTVAGISSNVTTVAGISSDVSSVAAKASFITADFVSDLNTLAVTDIVNDINTLATSDIVSDLNTLATSDFVADLNLLATSTNVNNIDTVATNISNVNTAATSISEITSFNDIFAVSASAPSSPSAGDLWYDTTNSKLMVYVSNSFQQAGAYLQGLTSTHVFTCTANQTDFTTDDASNTMSIYANGNTLVFMNGIRLTEGTSSTNDYYIDNNTIKLNSAADAGDLLLVEVFTKISTTQENSLNTLVTTAQGHANTASGHATTATTKASEASTSASNASTSETNAAASASTATTKASQASTSASNAATSETNAASSASSAASSAAAAQAAANFSVAGDSTPELGGDLDVLTYDIVSSSNRNIDILPNGTGKVNLDGDGSASGVTVSDGLVEMRTGSGSVAQIDMYCESSNAHKVSIKAPAHSQYSGNVNFTLPAGNGTNGQFLQTDGSGNLSYATVVSDLVGDSSPQLGGDLDANSNDILMGGQSLKFGTSKWEIVLDSGDNDLLFKYNGTTVFKLASNGAVTSANDVTAFGSP